MSELGFHIVHQADIRYPAAISILRVPTTGSDDIPLNDDVTVLTIPEGATSRELSSILRISEDKYSWHTIPPCVEDADVYTIEWEDTANTDIDDCKHIPGLPKEWQIAESTNLDSPAIIVYFIINEASEAN